VRFEAPDSVLAAIAAVGRTEDVRFSPANDLIAIAGYRRAVVLLLRARVEMGPLVCLDDFLELSSPDFREVHGVEFLDNSTLAVANRAGTVAIVRIPPWSASHARVSASSVIRGGKVRSNLLHRLHSPGSLVVTPGAFGSPELLVCNNYKHRVTRHLLDARRGYRARSHEIFLRRGLEVPDGIAVTPDSGWLAVSSHGTHDVKIYESSPQLGPRSEPAAVLPGAAYPHGLRFTPDGEHLLVADAGAPLVFVYARGPGWNGTHEPLRSVRVMDDTTFSSTRVNVEEGGPKGLDIDRTGTVVAITCESIPLRFFPTKDLTRADSLV
jgi:DNA-binding beta-propeller fold protein YncE